MVSKFKVNNYSQKIEVKYINKAEIFNVYSHYQLRCAHLFSFLSVAKFESAMRSVEPIFAAMEKHHNNSTIVIITFDQMAIIESVNEHNDRSEFLPKL